MGSRHFLGWDRLAGVAMLLASAFAVRGAPLPEPAPPPALLSDTGLYADVARREVDPQNLAFSPQYPLWTDGAAKRRWIRLPAGAAIDASDPDAWVFPVGTRFWKEFSFAGRPVETRMIERLPDGAWRYAAYAWSADGREATLAAAAGQRGAFDFGGGRSHAIPGVSDCKVCHEFARHADPRLRPPPALARPRPRRRPRRAAAGPGRRPRLARPRGPPRRAPGEPSRHAAAHRRPHAGGTGGARLPARQLRPLPQRRQQARERRPLPPPRAGGGGGAGGGDDGRAGDQGPRARAGPGHHAEDRPRASRAERARRAHGLAMGRAADAAARHGAGGRGGARIWSDAGSPSWKVH